MKQTEGITEIISMKEQGSMKPIWRCLVDSAIEHGEYEIEKGIIIGGIRNGESDYLCAAVTKKSSETDLSYCLLYQLTMPRRMYGKRFVAAELNGIDPSTKCITMLDESGKCALLPHAILVQGDTVYLPKNQINRIPKLEEVLAIPGISILSEF